jgi:NMD protein affecting ribosome stability and mRNA decay
MCERCGAVYENKRWREGKAVERESPVGFTWTVCPACRQVETGEYFGRVLIRGKSVREHEDLIRNRIENVARRARFTQVERRVISIDRRGDDLEVLTTSQKLAHRIVRSLMSAFGGRGTYAWSDSDGELTATWRWDEAVEPVPPLRGKSRAFRGRGKQV